MKCRLTSTRCQIVDLGSEYTAEEKAWLKAVDAWKASKSPVVRGRELLELLALLGYQRREGCLTAPALDMALEMERRRLAIAGGSRLRHLTACEVLGALRLAIAAPPVGQGPHRYVWVVDFPMFDGTGADGNPQPAHHPFTMPYPEDLPLLATDPLAVRSQAYDLVLNGWELGSGSVRIHNRVIQEQVFAALGIGPEEAESRFGFLLGAFRYGAPPHAGFAVGVDRLVAILAGEENIREVIAYPKTQSVPTC